MEQWKEIPHTNGDYFVSDMGRVKSKARVKVDKRGVKKHYGEFILKPIKHNKGYYKVNLFIDKVSYSRLIHILVAEAFIPKRADGLDVNHKNGDKHDNRVENLEWCTRKENMQHCSHNGLRKDIKKVSAIKDGKVIATGDFSRELVEIMKEKGLVSGKTETIARSIRKKTDTGEQYLGFTYIRV